MVDDDPIGRRYQFRSFYVVVRNRIDSLAYIGDPVDQR